MKLEAASPDRDASASDVSPQRFSSQLCSWIGPVLFTALLGVQLLIAILFIAGPIGKARRIPADQQPTLRARSYMHPERDVAIYICALPAILGAMTVATMAWRRLAGAVAARRGETARLLFLRDGTLLQALLAAGSGLVFLLILGGRYSIDPAANPLARTTRSLGGGAVLFLPPLAACICLALDMWRLTTAQPIPATARPRRLFDRLLTAGAVVFVVILVYIPASHWPDLIGRVTMREWVHHWNFFAIGPALGYLHGQAIGDGTYSQYGAGWPLLAAQLSRIAPLTYANLLGTAVLYGCAYYVGVFAFFRTWTGQAMWGAIAMMLAILWQLFNGVGPGTIQWSAPSSTLLRHPADIWFFLCLLLAARSTGPARAIACAGFFAGVGVLFEIDTGILLVGTFAGYAVTRAWIQRPGTREILRASILFISGFVIGWPPGIWVASRGHLSRPGYWPAFLEGLRVQAFTGFGMLPVSGVDDAGILLFSAVVIIYLMTIAWSFAARDDSATARRDRIIAAVISFYGLGLLLNFVGRSHPYNIFHASVPFALVTTFWLWRLCKAAPWPTSAPVVIGATLLALLITVPELRQYPCLAKSLGGAAIAKPGLTLVDSPRDLGGLPPAEAALVNDFKLLVEKLRPFAGRHNAVLILDSLDTSLYSATGIEPWSRYSSLLHMIQSMPTLKRVMQEIRQRQPEYIVFRAPAARLGGEFDEAEFQDVLDVLYPFVRQSYVLKEMAGSFEIWELRR